MDPTILTILLTEKRKVTRTVYSKHGQDVQYLM